MVWTTPSDKAHLHKSWHKFERGLCLYCGYHCADCPISVATCKCVFTKKDETETPQERADKLLTLENRGITDSWSE